MSLHHPVRIPRPRLLFLVSQIQTLSQPRSGSTLHLVPEYIQLQRLRRSDCPEHARVLRVEGGSPQEVEDEWVVVGFHHTPEEFVTAAGMVQHPADSVSVLPPPLLESHPREVAAWRCQQARMFIKLLSDTAGVDEQSWRELDSGLRLVFKGKRFAAWRWFLQEIDYEDVGIVDDAMQGFVLVGQPAFTGVFEEYQTQCFTLHRRVL
eukprot:5917567-Amphidinium_carterae.3